ncbi:hypothetical protein [Nocardioides pacificus]
MGVTVRPRDAFAPFAQGPPLTDGCRDTMDCSGFLRCDDCECEDPPPEPLEEVALRLVQGERSWLLGRADAGAAENGERGWVTWEVDVPVDAEPGAARLVGTVGG